MKSLLISLLVSVGCVTACQIEPQQASADSLLINCWLHSYEEQSQGSVELYRPCDHKEFGPSHYRRRLVLKENHEAEYLELSPVDAHQMKPGKWEYDEPKKALHILDAQGNRIWSYTVKSISKDKLELENA